MKAVFTAINSKFTHSALPVYLLSKRVPENITAVVSEYNINQPKAYIVRKLFSENADVYLFSCYIWNIDMILSIIKDLKKMKDCVIILGGSEVSYNPRDYEDHADYIVSGEGENIISDLLSYISSGKDPSVLRGVHKKGKEIFSFTEKAAGEEMFFPYTDEEISLFKDKIIYYESSRGCPHKCTYCLSGSDNKVRYKSIEKTKEELLKFIKAGVRQVKFIDRTFNANPKRAEELVEFILRNNEDTNFHFEVTAENMTDRLMELLKSSPAGMFQIEVGLQSINPMTLQAIRRKNELEKFERNIRNVLECDNVHVHADLIAALPYEDYESFLKGIDYLFGLKVHMLQVGILKVLKGSRIYDQAEEFGIVYSSDAPYNAFSTKWLSAEDMVKINYIEDIVEKYYNSMSFYKSLEKISSHFPAPHDMFEALSEYFLRNGLFDRGISKRELYEILIEFCRENNIPAEKEIAVDCMKYFDINNSSGVFERYDKAKTFEILSDEGFVNKYLPSSADLKAKDIFKQVAFYDADEDILILTKEKEPNIKGGFRHLYVKK